MLPYRTMNSRIVLIGLAFALIGLGACVSLDTVFNPEFLGTLGLGDAASTLPGEAPAVVVRIENDTDRVVEAKVSWRNDKDEILEVARTLGVGKNYAEVLICPIPEMTLGDVSDMTASGAIVRLGDGTISNAYMEVEPFGILLQQGTNYDCGDAITFKVVRSNATLSGYQTYVSIQHSGMQTEPDPNSNTQNP